MSCCCIHHFPPSTKAEGPASTATGPSFRHRSPWQWLVHRFGGTTDAEVDEAYSPASERLWRMLHRLGFDTERLGDPDWQSRMALMAGRCRACPHIGRCERWMKQADSDGTFRDFCVNAPLFEGLPRRAPRLRAMIGKG